MPAARRRRKAARDLQKLNKKGGLSPVVIDGLKIARTFWGKAWCSNLESYSDYSNRLPRGRTYARNGSVIDLKIAAGEVTARVSGRDLYDVSVKVAALPQRDWTSICRDCAGEIDSLVELLRGSLSDAVMERICRPKTGLFPAPSEIKFRCSCPDWASMCKHVAAALYGVGARLDTQPELLFLLRKVNQEELIASAGRDLPLSKKGPAAERVLSADGLSELFGLDLGTAAEPLPPAAESARPKQKTRKSTSRSRQKPAGQAKRRKRREG